MRVVFVDNFDSFTFNLVDEFARRGCEVEVWRNSAPAAHVVARAEEAGGPCLVVVSPGPGTPTSAGCSIEVCRAAAGRVPLLGVCLGHQALLEAYGGVVESAETVLHGRASRVHHRGDRLFDGIASPFVVGRYHSLAAHTVPADLEMLAATGRIVMAVRHRRHPLLGVQFHPESILTPEGGRLLDNVLREAREWGR